MSFQRRTPQLLHEDHQATVAVIEALDQMLERARKSKPDINDARVQKALNMAATAIEDEISTHFSFEEDQLFTLLEEAGDVGIGTHLRSEHKAILPLGKRVAEQSRAALSSGFTETSWDGFCIIAAELIERMIAHIQKEEMALLPLLDDVLDPETDMELSTGYANSH
jgi:hemerythrin-like domain-containing protein